MIRTEQQNADLHNYTEQSYMVTEDCTLFKPLSTSCNLHIIISSYCTTYNTALVNCEMILEFAAACSRNAIQIIALHCSEIKHSETVYTFSYNCQNLNLLVIVV